MASNKSPRLDLISGSQLLGLAIVWGRAGSANLMLVTLLIPPIAVGLSYTFLGERLSDQASIGFILIAVGLLVTDGRALDWIVRRVR